MAQLNRLEVELIQRRSIIDVNGCWIWQGTPQTGGYGQVNISGHHLLAHRASYMAHNGGWDCIPEGMLVCHTCDVPMCVNPSHLFLGKHLDNFKDAVSKGRALGQFPDGAQALPRRRKISHTQAVEIAESTGPVAEVAGRYGINASTVTRIRNGGRKGLVTGVNYKRTSTRGRKRDYHRQ